MPLLGLRTIVYPAPDLDAAKTFFTELTGTPPYFDEPFYVGYAVGGHELGLDPDADADAGPVTYWGVADVDAAVAELQALGATEHDAVREVGEGIRLASVRGPGGVIVGVIENPNA
jgi:catechol 2,3-dioxygenase-like lactoylglutathione lyase family enzyme